MKYVAEEEPIEMDFFYVDYRACYLSMAREIVMPKGPYSLLMNSEFEETIKFNSSINQFEFKDGGFPQGIVQCIVEASEEIKHPVLLWTNRKTDEKFLLTCRKCGLNKQAWCTHTQSKDRAFEVTLPLPGNELCLDIISLHARGGVS